MKSKSEKERLAALESYKLLDTINEKVYDDLIELASVICGTPIALISLVDEKRQWFKAKIGFDVCETSRDLAFCAHTLNRDTILEIQDTTLDERFKNNPLVTGKPYIKFYAGIPLKSLEGYNLGTLCVIDTKPRQLTELQIAALESLSRQVQANFELRRHVAIVCRHDMELEKQYQDLEKLEKSRQELINLVIHDLKSPLSAIQFNNEMLLNNIKDSSLLRYGETIKSSLGGMLRLILNVLDINTDEQGLIKPKISFFDVVDLIQNVSIHMGVRISSLGQTISFDSNLKNPVINSDSLIITRIIENLIDNSIKYAPGKGKLISIELAEKDSSTVEIKVKDQGDGIKAVDREKIFQRYFRVQDETGNEQASSRGLGLSFCKLATEALRGQIYIETNEPKGTAFCIRIPRNAVL